MDSMETFTEIGAEDLPPVSSPQAACFETPLDVSEECHRQNALLYGVQLKLSHFVSNLYQFANGKKGKKD